MSGLETAAERVKNLMQKGAFKALYQALLGQRYFRPHHCMKMLQIPLPRFSASGFKKKKTGTFSVSPDVTPSRLKAAFALPAALPKKSLTEVRVRRWKLKEQQVACKNLKALNKSPEPKKKNRVSLLKLSKKEVGQPEWESLHQAKEERQFVVNRVIPYLTDI